jgi:hypothetical protein
MHTPTRIRVDHKERPGRTVRYAALLLTSAAIASAACSSGKASAPAPSPSPPNGPTWYADVEPIVQVHCDGCHYVGGIGEVAFGEGNAQKLSGVMAARVHNGEMPPWQPGPNSKPIVGDRRLTPDQVNTIVAWANAGAPLGDPKDHQDRPPQRSFALPSRPFDQFVQMSAAQGYVAPGKGVTDEVRCFVVDVNNTENQWVNAVNWVYGQPAAVHHVGALVVGPDDATAARKLEGADGRPGYECAGSFGDGVNGIGGLNPAEAGSDTGTLLPSGTGILLPPHSAVIMSIHYLTDNLPRPDRTGVQLWFATADERAHIRPIVQYLVQAVSEVPCPAGVSSDPSDRCSREYGMTHTGSVTSVDTRQASNDYLLRKCGYSTTDKYYQGLPFGHADTSHFLVNSQCVDEIPYDATVYVVHNHMHTRGVASTLEIAAGVDNWDTLLDIPSYDWAWEAAYTLKDGVSVQAGQKVRLRCTFDNGDTKQWSVNPHQPGHHGPATPPLEPPQYHVAGIDRNDEMCVGFMSVEPNRFQNHDWPNLCAEAQAIYDANCNQGLYNFVAGPCTGLLEQYAAELVTTPKDLVVPGWCAPMGPGVNVGATCSQTLDCAIECGAVNGLASGLPASCRSQCDTNVNAYAPTQPVQSASVTASFQFGKLADCADQRCGSPSTWQDWIDCVYAQCGDLVELCYL